MNNYNGGNNYRTYQSSSNLCPSGQPQGQQPFMFGGSQGPRTQSHSSIIGQRRDAGVRDCMFWPNSLAPGLTAGTNYSAGPYNNNQYEGSTVYGGGNQVNYGGQTQRPQYRSSNMSSYPQPKAFIQLQGGQGQGEVKPMQIPCQMGPSGSQMGPIASLEPLTIKVTAPPGAGANGQPIQFQISPQALWGGQR